MKNVLPYFFQGGLLGVLLQLSMLSLWISALTRTIKKEYESAWGRVELLWLLSAAYTLNLFFAIF